MSNPSSRRMLANETFETLLGDLMSVSMTEFMWVLSSALRMVPASKTPNLQSLTFVGDSEA